jgi:hypothetical protein
MRTFIPAVVALLLLPAAAFCDDLTSERVQTLKQLQERHATVEILVNQKIMTAEEGQRADDFFRHQAEEVVGRPLSTWDEVNTLVKDADKTVGFGVFLNIVIVLAGFALLLALIGLAVVYLWPLLVTLPPLFYEVAAYVVTLRMLLAGYWWQPFQLWFLTIQPLWFVVPAALGFAGSVYLSYWLHWQRVPDAAGNALPRLGGRRTRNKVKRKTEHVYAGPGFITFPTVLFGLCTLVWGSLAIFYHRLFPGAGVPYFLAFITVMALQAFMGFSVITMPGCVALGWEKDSQVPKSTQASLILLVTYVAMKVSGNYMSEDVRLFETGVLFMGAFVYYLGLLVMSSKWYPHNAKDDATRFRRYVQMQVVTVISGVAALYLGATFEIGTLLGVGGTLFALYLLEKYYEIPWSGVGWAWSLVGVALALYLFVGFAQQHPQYFVWGIR